MPDDLNVIPLHQLATRQVEVIKAANGRILSARVTLRHLYEQLLDRRLITESQVRYGHQYCAMKSGFNSHMGYAKMMAIMGTLFQSEGEPSGDMERLYRMVFKALGKQTEEAILHAMLTPSTGYFHGDSIFPGVFEKLESAFIAAKKTLEDEDKTS